MLWRSKNKKMRKKAKNNTIKTRKRPQIKTRAKRRPKRVKLLPAPVSQARLIFGGYLPTERGKKWWSLALWSDISRRYDEAATIDRLEAILQQQYADAYREAARQISGIEKLGDISQMSLAELQEQLDELWEEKFRLTEQEKRQKIEQLESELKKLWPKIKAENLRLKKEPPKTGEELGPISKMKERYKKIQDELKFLRAQK